MAASEILFSVQLGDDKMSFQEVSGLEEAHEVRQAEEWQRTQAWATWEAIQAGDARDVPMDELRAATERALARLRPVPRSR